MSNITSTRRNFFKTAAGTAAAAGLLANTNVSHAAKGKDPFTYCLNTSTIRGQNLGIEAEVDTAGKAGYNGIEPWFRTIKAFTDAGGKLKDLRKRIQDNGLTVDSAIGFAKWVVDDEEQRSKGFEEAKRDMDTIAQLGGTRIAAPPAGAP